MPSAGETAVSIGIAQRLPDGTVQFEPPADAGQGTAAESWTPPHVQPYTEPPVQREAQAREMSTGSAADASAGLLEPPPLNEDEQLASQAHKMYPFIARLLRIELSRERDRYGNLSGFRH